MQREQREMMTGKADLWWYTAPEIGDIPDHARLMNFAPRTQFGLYVECAEAAFPLTAVLRAFDEGGNVIYMKDTTVEEGAAAADTLQVGTAHILLKDYPEKIAEPCSLAAVLRDASGGVQEFTSPCIYHRISGKLVDFDGSPLQAAFVANRYGFQADMGAYSRADGSFEAVLPAGVYNNFLADDSTYATSTLENWCWHMIVDRDEELTLKIGNGEVYSLHAWPSCGGQPTMFLAFRPMALTGFDNGAPKQYMKEIDGAPFPVIDAAPPLTGQDISVYLNGVPARVTALQQYYEVGAQAMPCCLVQVDISGFDPFGKQEIVLEYDSPASGARSQGRTQVYLHSKISLA